MQAKKCGKSHRAWIILLGCCLIQGGSLGLIHNCRGIFYSPVIEDLHFGMGGFSFYVLFFGFFSALSTPLAEKMFARIDSRMLLGSASFVFSFSTFCMGYFNSLLPFYVAGAVQGISGAFLMYYPVPFILGNWFKKTGFSVGVSSAFAGIVAIAGSPVGNLIIENYGWRSGYRCFGVISALMMVPVSVFLLRTRPEDVGLTPYGAAEEALGDTAKRTETNLFEQDDNELKGFFLLMTGGVLASFVCGLCPYFSAWSIFLGQGSEAGAWMLSACMTGNVISKAVFGKIHDKHGLKASFFACMLTLPVGLFMLNFKLFTIRIVGSFLYGTCAALSAVLFPISIRDLYGPKKYGRLLSYGSAASAFGGPFFTVVLGYIIDSTKKYAGYDIVLWLTISITLGAFASFFTAIKSASK